MSKCSNIGFIFYNFCYVQLQRNIPAAAAVSNFDPFFRQITKHGKYFQTDFTNIFNFQAYCFFAIIQFLSKIS